jgi:hypothetical protein
MVKRKTDEQLQNEMNLHSRNAFELLQTSQKVHQDAIRLWSENDRQEHSQTLMNLAIELQRSALAESKKVTRLQKILFRRQYK